MIGFKTLLGVVVEPPLHIAVNGNPVVVVEGDEFIQPPDTCERTHFVADAFHHAAVAQEAVRTVVDHGETVAVKFRGEQLFSQGHTDGVGNALPQGARRRFHARRHAHFGMTGGFASHLTEVLQIVERQIVAGEVQQGVLQHRAVAVRENEAVAADPLRVLGIVTEMLRPEGDGNISHAHGHAGVTGFGFLDGVHGKRTNGVGHRLRGNGFGHSLLGYQ